MIRSLVAVSAGIALFGASAVLLSGSASAGIAGGCKVPAAVFNSKGKGSTVSFGSANTNAGNGNGGEIASIGGCVSGLPYPPDSSVNINAFNGSPYFNTDPGNSLPHQQGINIP